MKLTRKELDALTEEYGSPLYVFDEEGFAENFRKLDQAMKSSYENYRIAYSFKTNYTPYICKTAKALGAYAEVVSGMEYDIAKRIGYRDDEIIFNGPCKSSAGIEAMRSGCLVNADSLDEVAALAQAARLSPERVFRIGLRFNLDVGQGFISRFGMDEQDLAEAFRTIKNSNLRAAGLHCHISRARGLEAWERRTRKALELADRFFPDGPEFLDLGSGMFGSMAPEFAAQFENVPTYEQYAQVTAGLVAEHFGDNKPILFTEPGTTLVNRFVECISKVETIKRISGQWFAVLDCSVHNLGETSVLKRLPVSVVSGGEKPDHFGSIDLTGYTCLEQDVMRKGFSGDLAKGDYVIFGNVGGYSNVLKPPFIRPNCAMIAQNNEGGFELIKTVETAEDLLVTYRF